MLWRAVPFLCALTFFSGSTPLARARPGKVHKVGNKITSISKRVRSTGKRLSAARSWVEGRPETIIPRWPQFLSPNAAVGSRWLFGDALAIRAIGKTSTMLRLEPHGKTGPRTISVLPKSSKVLSPAAQACIQGQPRSACLNFPGNCLM